MKTTASCGYIIIHVCMYVCMYVCMHVCLIDHCVSFHSYKFAQIQGVQFFTQNWKCLWHPGDHTSDKMWMSRESSHKRRSRASLLPFLDSLCCESSWFTRCSSWFSWRLRRQRRQRRLSSENEHLWDIYLRHKQTGPRHGLWQKERDVSSCQWSILLRFNSF